MKTELLPSSGIPEGRAREFMKPRMRVLCMLSFIRLWVKFKTHLLGFFLAPKIQLKEKYHGSWN